MLGGISQSDSFLDQYRSQYVLSLPMYINIHISTEIHIITPRTFEYTVLEMLDVRGCACFYRCQPIFFLIFSNNNLLQY